MEVKIHTHFVKNQPWQIYTGPGLNIRDLSLKNVVGFLSTGKVFWIESKADLFQQEAGNAIGHTYSTVYNLEPANGGAQVIEADSEILEPGEYESQLEKMKKSGATRIVYNTYSRIYYGQSSYQLEEGYGGAIIGCVANQKLEIIKDIAGYWSQPKVLTNYLNGAKSLFSTHIKKSLQLAGWDSVTEFSHGNFAYKNGCFGVKSRKILDVQKFNSDQTGYVYGPNPDGPAYYNIQIPVGSWIWFKEVSFQAATGETDKNSVRCYGWSLVLGDPIEVIDNAMKTVNIDGTFYVPTFIKSDIIDNDWHNYTISTMIND